MAFLDKAGLQTLTNKLVQGDAIKVASSRGNTVKNVIDNITRECSDVENSQTMTLEDETGHFMIGKGKDIDVSGDVEAGKISFGFKGKTLINPITKDAGVFSPQANGCIIKEDSVVFDARDREIKGGLLIKSNFPIKPDTVYTLCFNVIKNDNFSPSYFAIDVHGNYCIERKGNLSIPREVGFHKMVLTTKKNWLVNHPNLFIKLGIPTVPSGNGLFEIGKDMMFLEGDWTNKEVPPFFTGIKSSFETEEERKITHTGKNLWKWGDPTRFAQYTRTFSESFMLAGRTYTISYGNITQHFEPNDVPNIRFASESGELKNFYLRGEPIVFTPKENVRDIIIYSNGYNWSGSTGKFATIENFQIEEGRGATEYAPYVKEEKIIELDEPLRSLPNGVCDEITEDGKLVKRVGKTVFSGVEKWNFWGDVSPEYIKTYTFDSLPNRKIVGVIGEANSDNLICDKLPISKRSSLSQNNYPCIFRGTSYIGLSIKKSELAEPYDDNSVKQWIQKNNLTIYYEIEEKESSNEQFKFNVSQHNRIDILSSIAPTTTYKVPLNRAAQIDNSIKTIQELKQRIELLEQAYDNHFLESQYKLSLLKLEHQIESEEI